MVLDLDIGVIFTVGATMVGAFWGMIKLVFTQFEKGQNVRFDELNEAITGQELKLHSHLTKQDDREKSMLFEIRKVDERITQVQVESARTYQTQGNADKQFSQLIAEIRGLGTRIDALHRAAQ